MAKAEIYNNGIMAGHLEKKGPNDYHFSYTNEYYTSPAFPPISLTLPKTRQSYQSPTLFSFFAGLLAEGINKDIQCRLLRIDERDDFTRLLKTADEDTIGGITVKEIMD
ncbi:MAG TPA: HipA N-terminal domain-containing protein [Puia sp.]|jgi:serine/threonine-protein kinase HipA|nr:HipA N-terminal domain-containing protein [Puia sp.]